MKAFVGVTDYDWFRFLRERSELEEVNFWQPGGNRQFRALDAGELFLFKLRSPRNFIVGGGFFTRSYLLPVTLAWTAFEEGNGAASFARMRRAIESHRAAPAPAREDYTIGCIILQKVVFLSEDRWIQVPGALTGNSPGKTFDGSREPIASITQQLFATARDPGQPSWVAEPPRPMYGEPRAYQPRLGQGTFRVEVTRVYDQHCAITGEKALPTLDAAHILPVAEGGEHRLDNGLLMRSDLHRLFDRGYVTVTPDRRVRVSRRLRTDFDNGEPYFPLDRQQIWLPPRAEERPSREFLEWHAESVFLG